MEKVEPRITVRPARCGHHYDKNCRCCRDAWEWTDGEMERLQQATRANDEEIARLRSALKDIAFMRPVGDVDKTKNARALIEKIEKRALQALGASNA